MAGSAQLTGARADTALTLLRRVTNVLDDAGIAYWLEGGTLLGIVREQRLLPWDTDMDISVSSDQLPKLLACRSRLRAAGYRVRLRHHAITMPPLEAETPRLLKVRTRRWYFFRGDVLLDVFVKYRANDKYYWSIGRTSNPVLKSAPAHFYDELGQIEFAGKRYSVPRDYEGYLAFRYGDWRTPVHEWNCFKDDNAIVCT